MQSGEVLHACFLFLIQAEVIRHPPTFLHCTQRTAVTPCGPKDDPQSRQRDWPSPQAVLLILSSRLERRLRTRANKLLAQTQTWRWFYTPQKSQNKQNTIQLSEHLHSWLTDLGFGATEIIVFHLTRFSPAPWPPSWPLEPVRC